MDPNGGTGVLAVTTQPECAWDASSTSDWISALAPATGQGTGNVSFRVAANDGAAAREGLITVNGEQARVSQRAPCRYELNPTLQTVIPNGGTGTFTIATASECSWTAAADVSWITITTPAGGRGSGTATVGFSVGLNDGAERTGIITAGNQRTLVTQLSGGGSPSSPTPPSPQPPASPCTFALSPGSEFVSSNEGSASVSVTASRSNCPWTAASNATWILVSTGSTGMGNGTVTYRVRNNTGGRRSGTMTIAGLAFTVTQAQVGGLAPSEGSAAR